MHTYNIENNTNKKEEINVKVEIKITLYSKYITN